MIESRRNFLVKLAKASAYAAPVILTMAAPEGLSAQQRPTLKASDGEPPPDKGGGGGGKNMDVITDFQVGPSAPWAADP